MMIRIESQEDADKATLIRNLIDGAFKGGGLLFAKQSGLTALALDEEIIAAGRAWEAIQAKVARRKPK